MIKLLSSIKLVVVGIKFRIRLVVFKLALSVKIKIKC